MKVLLIGPIPPPLHGCSLANKVLIDQLKNARIDFSVINTETENISSDKVGSFSVKKLWNFIGVYKEINLVTKASIVYTTPGQTFLGVMKYAPFYIFCIFLKIPYVIHIHGNYFGKEYRSLGRFKKKLFHFLISNAKAGIVLSKSLRDNFQDLLLQNSVFVVENFAEEKLLQIEFNKQVDKLRLLYLSNLMVEKGILDFLDSLILLKKNNIEFEAHIAGKIEDGLMELIENRLNFFSENVFYHGVVFGYKKTQLLANANVFILPTYYKMEGQPISLIEAMATGNIIVTTNHSGIPDIITNKNGFLLQPKSPNILAETLVSISSKLESYVNEIGLKNREYVESNFTEKEFTNKIIKILNEASDIK